LSLSREVVQTQALKPHVYYICAPRVLFEHNPPQGITKAFWDDLRTCLRYTKQVLDRCRIYVAKEPTMTKVKEKVL